MKILAFALAPLWSPHFETDLELIAKHHSQGDEVVVVSCFGGLRSCIANPRHHLIDCVACRSKSKRGYRAIGRDPVSVALIPKPTFARDAATTDSIARFESMEAVAQFEYRGLPVGRGVASSLISILRDNKPDLKRHEPLLRRLVESSQQMSDFALEAIATHEPDLVYVFNGRFATSLAVIEACEQAGVTYRTHDAAYVPGKYKLIESGTVNDLDSLKAAIRQTWEEAESDDDRRSRIASSFFTDRRYGGERSGPRHLNFTTRMQPGSVPLKSAGNYVLILNSSEDELAALTQYANPVYSDQIEALESLVLEPELRDVQLILRVHPNLKGVDSEQTRRTDALAGVPNLHIIGPEEEIDTYSLMDGADVAVSFGSTAGIESVFWGVPSILIGRAPFEELGVNTPASHDAAVQMILDPPAAAPIEAAFPYGYFVVAFGEEFLFYEQTSYFSGAFEGSEVRPSLLPRLVRKTRNALRLLQSSIGAWRGHRRDKTFRVAD